MILSRTGSLNTENIIIEKLDTRFECQHLEVVNESGGHNVPAGSETHFKVVLVAAEFNGQRLLARHPQSCLARSCGDLVRPESCSAVRTAQQHNARECASVRVL